MKKYVFLIVCAIAVMMSCKNKGQASEASGADSTAVDSVLAELNDTTPLPMMLYYMNPQNMMMVYWIDPTEPEKTKDNADFYNDIHNGWGVQNMFTRNAANYTKMLMDDKWVDIKFIGEVTKDPDGKTLYGGEMHGRPSIPSPGLKYAFANPKDAPKSDEWSNMYIVVHKDYLTSRKQLKIDYPDSEKPMPKAVVKKMEQKYGMTASHSQICSKIDGRYTQGFIQFVGEYKKAPKNPDNDYKKALALEVIIDGDSLYTLEVLGYYDEESKSCTWNADDGGDYCPTNIYAAFEGPKGLELCYRHSAPESCTVGMYLPRNGEINELEYACYHVMVDEQEPLWNKEIAEMQKLYLKESEARKDCPLKKFNFIDIDNDGIDEVWMRDKDENIGALFTFKDRKPQLICIETEKMKASFKRSNDGRGSVKIAGPAGGSSYATELYVLKKSQVVERFFMMEVEGEITDAELNGKTLTKWEAADYLDKTPSIDNKPYLFWQEKEEQQ